MTAGSIAVPQIIPLRYPLGKKKNLISLNTQIEIRTETKNCNLFYTLNNKKPDPFQKYGQKCTYKYKSPFTLGAGNVTIKAMAMTTDGSNHSSVVTKVFTVSDSAEETYELTDGEEEPRSGTAKLNMSLSEQFKERVRTISRESVRTNVSGTQLQIAGSPKLEGTTSLTDLPQTPSKFAAPLNQSSPIFVPHFVTVEKPKNICLYCSYPRGLKSTEREVYCTNCGSKLPPLPNMKKEAVRMAVCPSCQSEQPSNESSDSCLVCSTVLIQPPPLPSIKSQTNGAKIEMETILCLYCGTLNSPHLLTCVTCANTLYAGGSGGDAGSHDTKETIMHPITGSTFVMCGTCGRVNVSDARYCDWCGCRPIGSNVDLVCQECDSRNDWTARHCSQCGFIMKCPLRPEVEQGSKMRMPAGSKFDHVKWIPIADVDTPMEDKGILAQAGSQTVGTQTKGLFYASANTITAKKASEVWQKMTKSISQDRVSRLSSYSPGNGKWRSQVDHMCACLKAHSATSSELQNGISNCQIGAIQRSSTEVDEDNLQLTLTLLFALKDITNVHNSTVSKYFTPQATTSSAIERSKSSSSSITESSLRRSSSSNTLRKKPSLKRLSTINLKVEDYLLSAEVGPDGLGRRDITSSLIQKVYTPNDQITGANVNYVDTTRGLPLLLLATSSGHLEAVKVFLEEGADLTVVAKKTGNTALHEAVKLGENGGDMLTALLSYGANSNTRNKDNLTACELAAKLGHQSLTARFASHLGASMLGPLAKKQSGKN